jgi:diphosphomevalonate decarboxylase
LAQGDFPTVARISEADAFAMHAVMQTASPTARYFEADSPTSSFLAAFVAWRDANNVRAFWTLDAGPNPHLLFAPEERDAVLAFVSSWLGSGRARAFLENADSTGLVMGRRDWEEIKGRAEGLIRKHEHSGRHAASPLDSRTGEETHA